MSNHAVNAPEIRNGDVTWDGTPLGLQPRIANPKTAHLVDALAGLDHQLVELLRDPDRFAVAHVLLTMRHDALKSFDANSGAACESRSPHPGRFSTIRPTWRRCTSAGRRW